MGKQLFDKYTYLHFAAGIVIYFWGVSLITWIIIHTIFEILENTKMGMHIINRYVTLWPGGKPHSDSLTNSIGDTLGAVIGWISAYLVDTVSNKYDLYNSTNNY